MNSGHLSGKLFLQSQEVGVKILSQKFLFVGDGRGGGGAGASRFLLAQKVLLASALYKIC